MGWPTAADTLNQAAKELGLIKTGLDDPFASTDANLVQLRTMLSALGRAFLEAFRWTHLTQEKIFSTANGTEAYALPSDFHRYVDQTGWNRTQPWPLQGPVTAQAWQMLKARNVAQVRQSFRFRGNQILLTPTPTAIETLAFEYISKWWVDPGASGTPSAETTTAATDALWFDANLLQRGLILKWLTTKGFPAQEAQDAYDEAWAAATGGDGAAPVLSLNGTAANTPDRFLSNANLPDFGWGM